MGCSNFLDFLVFQMIVQSTQSALIDEVNKSQSGYWTRQNGRAYRSEVPQQTINEDAGSVGEFVSGYWSKGTHSGKVMVDVNELANGKPNSFHIHSHEKGITISNFKADGTVERFTFGK